MIPCHEIQRSLVRAVQVRDFQDVSQLPQQDPLATVTVRVRYSDLRLAKKHLSHLSSFF